jgi:tRNA A37 threonylcarbamoyladenosine modification protein TsaB
MDAQRGEVFAALYAADAASLLIDPSSEPPGPTLERWAARLTGRERFVGDGALRYRDAIARATAAGAAAIVDPVPPLAGVIGTIASTRPDRGVLPHAVVPIYIRRSDAELARDRKWRS